MNPSASTASKYIYKRKFTTRHISPPLKYTEGKFPNYRFGATTVSKA